MAEIRLSGRRHVVGNSAVLLGGAFLLTLLLAVPSVAVGSASPRTTGIPGATLPGGLATAPMTGWASSAGLSLLNASNLSFKLLGTVPNQRIASSFWGADVRIFSPANSTLANGFNVTGLTFVRWPGGAVADAFNMTANRIYHNHGVYATPPTGISQFAHWCTTVGCRAIVQLPAEINSPSTGAYYVNYIETTIGFHPAYYEIGNEPGLWRHFNIDWANWNTTQKSKVTPDGYAHVVQAYVAAIHKVAPRVRIIGLPGFGQGGYNEPTWIQASVAVNGPNLSAVAIHVYPTGHGPASSPTLGQFYQTLNGHGTLTYRVPRDQAAIAAGCPTCTNIKLLVTELGAGNGGGAFAPFMKTYDDVPYIGTELFQGIELNVSNIDLFSLQGRYAGSLLNASYHLTPVGTLYQTFFTQLGRDVYPVGNLSFIPGVQILVVGGAQVGTLTLMIISTNTTTAQRVSLLGTGFPIGPGEVRSWNASATSPAVVSYAKSIPLHYVVPPQGVLLVKTTAALPLALGAPPGTSPEAQPSTLDDLPVPLAAPGPVGFVALPIQVAARPLAMV